MDLKQERTGKFKMFTMREIFDLGMKIERNGEKFYRNGLKKISDPPLQSLFEWLAEEEVKHREWFAFRRDSIKTHEKEIELEEMQSSVLQHIMGDQSFSLEEADLDRIESDKDLLEIAIEFEKDTVLFFEMITSLVDDEETLRQLHVIIDEENRHIKSLEDFKDGASLMSNNLS